MNGERLCLKIDDTEQRRGIDDENWACGCGGGLRGVYAAGIRKKYPLAAEKLCLRAQRYDEGVALAQKHAEQAGC